MDVKNSELRTINEVLDGVIERTCNPNMFWIYTIISNHGINNNEIQLLFNSFDSNLIRNFKILYEDLLEPKSTESISLMNAIDTIFYEEVRKPKVYTLVTRYIDSIIEKEISFNNTRSALLSELSTLDVEESRRKKAVYLINKICQTTTPSKRTYVLLDEDLERYSRSYLARLNYKENHKLGDELDLQLIIKTKNKDGEKESCSSVKLQDILKYLVGKHKTYESEKHKSLNSDKIISTEEVLDMIFIKNISKISFLLKKIIVNIDFKERISKKYESGSVRNLELLDAGVEFLLWSLDSYIVDRHLASLLRNTLSKEIHFNNARNDLLLKLHEMDLPDEVRLEAIKMINIVSDTSRSFVPQYIVSSQKKGKVKIVKKLRLADKSKWNDAGELHLQMIYDTIEGMDKHQSYPDLSFEEIIDLISQEVLKKKEKSK